MALQTINGSDAISTGPAKLNNNFDFLLGLLTPAGSTVEQAVTPSPYTYTAGTGIEYVYISGGVITACTRNGTSISVAFPLTVILPPGESVVIFYDELPTVVVNK